MIPDWRWRYSSLVRGYGPGGVIAGLWFLAASILKSAHVASNPHNPLHAQATTILLGGTACGAVCIVIGIITIRLGGRERRLERARREERRAQQARRAAARQAPEGRADGTAEATPQEALIPSMSTVQPIDLTLPIEIMVRPRWRAVLANWLLLAGAALFLTYLGMLLGGSTLRQALIVLVMPVLLGPLLAFLLVNEAAQPVALTDEGMTIRNGLSPQKAPPMVRWADVDWFARFRYGQRQGSPACYELGSARGRVRWIRLYPPPQYVPLVMAASTKPTIPFERYEQQMDVIQALIMERTQLPLHEV